MTVSNQFMWQLFNAADNFLLGFVTGGWLIALLSIIQLVFPFEPYWDWITVTSILTAVAGIMSLGLGSLHALLGKVRS